MGSKKFVRIPFRKEAQSVNRIVSKLEGGERQFYTLSIILAFTSQRRYAVPESPFFFRKKTKTQDHEGRVLLSLYCFFDWQKKEKERLHFHSVRYLLERTKDWQT